MNRENRRLRLVGGESQSDNHVAILCIQGQIYFGRKGEIVSSGKAGNPVDSIKLSDDISVYYLDSYSSSRVKAGLLRTLRLFDERYCPIRD
jgi:hypothetical protein